MLIDYYRLMKYKAPMNRNRLAAFLVSIAVLVLGVVMPPMPPPVAAVPLLTPTLRPTTPPTGTPCPMPTPERLVVDAVVSPTSALTQTITVYAGNAVTVTVTSASGTFTATGSFNASNNPARVTIDLLPNTTHNLVVRSFVRQIVAPGGCIQGGYTLTTGNDSNGAPLTIVQQGGSTATATPTTVPGTPTSSVPTSSPTLCPQPTTVPLWVDPISSADSNPEIVAYTNAMTIVVRINDGAVVRQTYTLVGSFSFNNPARVRVAAVAANNYVSVTAFVRMQGPGDCRTQYTLSTVNDRTGNLLYFVASNPVLQNRAFLPFVRR